MDLDEFLDQLMKQERVLKFPNSMYYSEGTKYLNLSQFSKALDFLNEAIENDPTHTKSLLKRSKCLIALRDYKNAIDDANRVLNLYPDCVEAIDLKGQAQYMMGDFEGGYITYLEGKKKKPINNTFRLGQQLCEDALDNTFLTSSGLKVTEADTASIVNTQKDDKKFENKLKSRRSVRECFGADRKFLEDLMSDKNLCSIHGFCKDGIEHIKDCERFWSMEKPLHLRKKKLKLIRWETKLPRPSKNHIKICNAAKRRAENELKKERIDDCITEVGKMLNVIEHLPKEEVREKMKFQCDAYHLLGLAYKKGENLSLSFKYLLKELEVAIEFNLIVPKTRAFHQLGEFYHHKRCFTRTFQCLNKVLAAFGAEIIEELTSGCMSIEDVKSLLDAQKWASDLISSVKTSLRETIITPVVNMIDEYSKNQIPENLDSSSE